MAAAHDTATTSRRRFHQTDDPEEMEVPMDEDTQHKIVKDIANRIATQQQRISRLLQIVCVMSAIVSAALVLFFAPSSNAILPWCLSISMGIVFCTTPFWFQKRSPEEEKDNNGTASTRLGLVVSYYPTLVILSWFMAAVYLFQHRKNNNNTMPAVLTVAVMLFLHGLCVAASYYVRYDHQASQTLLSQVAAAKYRYKSL